MPIYEYECSSCHHTCDLIQKISDEPEKKCPICGKNDLIKLVSAAGFKLKGTGWYETDFKNKPTKPPAESKSSDTGNSTSATKTETPSTKGES